MAKRDTQSGRALTRKQIAISRKEREQLRLIHIGLGVVVALIVIVLGIGLYQTFVLEPNAPVASVNDSEITTRDYQARVRYERFLLNAQLQQITSQRDALVNNQENPQMAEFLMSQYEQRIDQIWQQRIIVDRQTVELMIEDKLIEVEAAARGITVSEEDINEDINHILAGQLGGLTAAAVSETATARVEASATAALWTPTPTFTPSPTLTTTEEITQPTATPANTPTPAPTPTPNVIDQAALGTQYTNWLNTLAENADIDETEYRQIVHTLVLRDKLQEILGSEVPTSAEQSRARHILVETEEEANEIIERLEAGEDFADLAAELSTDPGSGVAGGDLGFVARGRFVGPIDDAVFTLPIGEVSRPIETQFGWHVVEVLEREERELSPADYRLSQQLAYSDWLTNARDEAAIEDLWTIDKAPEDPLLEQQSRLPQASPEP